MRMLKRLRSCFISLLRRNRFEQNMADEIRFHLDSYVQDLVLNGTPRSEAERRARVEFGGVEGVKEECRKTQPLRWLEELGCDVRVGFRTLRHEKVFAASVTLILALGIGATVTMFSVLNAVVLRPLPYSRPSELVRISTHLMRENQWDGTSMANFLDWKQQSHSFANMTYYRRISVSTVTLAGFDAPQRVQEGLVGPEFFAMLGTPPLIGRAFSKEEFDRHERVVVISERLWQEQFAKSAGVIGKSIVIADENHVVLGVMPHSFQLPTSDTQLWRPFSVLEQMLNPIRNGDGIEVSGRLAPAAGLEAAKAEMIVIAARLREAYPVDANIDIRLMPLLDYVVGSQTRRGVWLGFVAVLSVLVIACANVGGMLLARAAQRRHEFALRAALGAGRMRLMRQILAESVCLWAVATVAGIFLSYGFTRLLLIYVPRTIPRLNEIGIDLAAVGVALIAGFAVVALCGTIPTLVTTAADPKPAFNTRTETSIRRHWLQDLLVTAQVAGTVMLLVAALLFAQSFIRAQNEDPGYPANNLLITRIDLPRKDYGDRAALAQFFQQARERIGNLPGVVSVGGITDFFIRRNAGQWITIEGRVADKDGNSRLAIEGVTPGFFRGAGIDVLEGRDFDDRDYQPDGPRVFIVSDALARRFWPGESAIGKRVVSGETAPKDGKWGTIVGVVKDIRREGLDVNPILLAFEPSFLRGMDLTVRASTAVEPLIPAVRHEIHALDKSLPLTYVAPVAGRLSERLGERRFQSQVLAVFAAIALMLSAAGLYAVLAYQVTLRRREIGIRSALGADRHSIVGLVLKKGLRLAVLGAVLGVFGAVTGSTIIESLLYQTASLNPGTYVAATAFLLLVAIAASWLPACRAARIGPMNILRGD